MALKAMFCSYSHNNIKFNKIFKNVHKSIKAFKEMSLTAEELQKFQLPDHLKDGESCVWTEYAAINAIHQPLDLGTGFPDFLPSSIIQNSLKEVATQEENSIYQYARSMGHLRLSKVLSQLYSNLLGRTINPYSEIIITYGGQEALYNATMGCLKKGDEVILIEPFYDAYKPLVTFAGGVCKFTSLKKTGNDNLKSSDWQLDKKELESLFNKNTKMIIINTPQNPIGKVYTKEELTFISSLCKKWNVICLSDEVYEWDVYDNAKHVRIASLPGMWERTITVGSAGKTFLSTGLKTGWAYGPDYLIRNLQTIHQTSVYACVTPIQEALAIIFEKELEKLSGPGSLNTFYKDLLQPKRDFLIKQLRQIGLKPIVPEGSFFIVCDWTPLESKIDISSEKDEFKDFRITKWLIKNLGLATIPMTVFYDGALKIDGQNYIRFCFVKKEETLKGAGLLLSKLL